MGRPPEGTAEEGGYKSPEVVHLWPHHRKMARLVASGCQPSEIATLTGFTEAHVSRIFGSPAFQAIVNDLMERADEIAVDHRQEIQALVGPALENVSEAIHMEVADRKDRELKLKASQDILDRAGYRKQERPVGELHLHKHKHYQKLTDEELRDEVLDLTRDDSEEPA